MRKTDRVYWTTDWGFDDLKFIIDNMSDLDKKSFERFIIDKGSLTNQKLIDSYRFFKGANTWMTRDKQTDELLAMTSFKDIAAMKRSLFAFTAIADANKYVMTICRGGKFLLTKAKYKPIVEVDKENIVSLKWCKWLGFNEVWSTDEFIIMEKSL